MAREAACFNSAATSTAAIQTQALTCCVQAIESLSNNGFVDNHPNRCLLRSLIETMKVFHIIERSMLHHIWYMSGACGSHTLILYAYNTYFCQLSVLLGCPFIFRPKWSYMIEMFTFIAVIIF